MKKIFFSFFALLLMSSDSFIPWQGFTHCEDPSATSLFAALTDFEAFRNIHPIPSKQNYSVEGKMIEFKASDGNTASAYLVSTSQTSNKYLFVFHEWWGLNQHIKQESDNWAKKLKSVNIIALDLYDGKVATNRKDAANYMQNTDENRAKAIIEGALNFVGKDAEIATIGWCFGGGWSLQSSLIAKNQTVGCIIYYGMPEKDVAKLKTLNTDVLGIFASEDKWINTDVVNEFEKNMKAAGKDVTIKSFEGAHGFANPSNPKYNKDAAKEAQQLSTDYLQKRFQLS